MLRRRLPLVLGALVFLLGSPAGRPALDAASPRVLWQIGKQDASNAELALAPKDYRSFKDDPLFVVGASDARQAWPYVHPGPDDAWAGSRAHAFTVLFGLKSAPPAGACRLVIDLLQTHPSEPPHVEARVNGFVQQKALPKGSPNARPDEVPTEGHPEGWALDFPCDALRAGNNAVVLTTASGSWMLYDDVRMEAPEGVETAPVAPETVVTRARALPVWEKSGDASVQPIELTVRRVGPDIEAVIRAGAGEGERVSLKQGFQEVEARVPASEEARRVDVAVEVAGQAPVTESIDAQPPRLREMWLLPHSHVDIGYTHRQEEVVGIQVGNLEKAMRLAQSSAGNPEGARFKWNPEAVWTIDHFLQKATPAQREAFVKAVRDGEVGVDGLFANLLTGLCRPEELLQAVRPALKVADLTGVPVTSAATCDVPGWTWGLVPVLAQAGVKYFAIGPNAGDRVGTIHRWDDKPFYWRSESGKERVLCWVVDNYHHHGVLEPEVLTQLERLQAASFPYDTAFMFWVGAWPNGTVDNAPPDEELAAKVMAWNAKYARPRITIGLAGTFFAAFERQYGAKVPEASGDLTPYWEDGAGSTSLETGRNRASAERLSQAETVFALRGPAEHPADKLLEAWKNVLLYSEHTWGADRSISQPDDPFTQDQWKTKQGFALAASQQSSELLTSAVLPLRRAVSSLDIYNTTQWNRTNIVALPREMGASGVADERGHPLPSQRLSNGELVFIAKDIPAYAARRYRILWRRPFEQGKARATGTVLETSTLRVEVDAKTGAVKSLKLAGVEHDFVDSSAPVALNDYRYVLGEDVAGATTNGPVKITVTADGPLVAALRIESDAPGCNTLVREIRVVDGVDRVEIADTVDRKAVREKDAVHFGFGFNVPAGKIHMETPWGVVRPNEDQLPGSNHNWFTVQRWVDVSNTDSGITLAPVEAPLIEIGGITAALLGSVAEDRWLTATADSPTIYSWAQNNHWHTNYKADQPGETTFHYVLWPHAGGYSPADAARFGLEVSRPLIAAPSDARKKLPAPLLEVSNPNVLVETVKVSDDNRALVLRLFGVSGKNETVTLKWKGWRPRAMWRTDAGEKRLGRLPDGPIDVPAYGLVQVRADR